MVVVERVTERRGKQDSSRGSGLMMVVNDLWKPFLVEDAVDCFGLGLSNHIKVAIVVVTDVLLVKPGHTRSGAFRWIRLAHIPVGNQVESVRVDANSQKYVV